jgi:hypothetical protein
MECGSAELNSMTQLLQQAIDAVQRLGAEEQNAIASLILDEIEDDRRWAESYARSQEKLAALAGKVRTDIAAGRVQSKGIDEL